MLPFEGHLFGFSMKIALRNVDEVAFLRIHGFEILKMHIENECARPTVVFELESKVDEIETDRLRNDFLNRKSRVEPRLFAELVRDTSNLLFDMLRGEKKQRR